MDVEVSAGRDSTWRRAAAAAATTDDDEEDAGGGGRGGGMEAQVVPLELYDSARAKIDANLRWLFAKAYGIGKDFSVIFWHDWDCEWCGCVMVIPVCSSICLSIVHKLNSVANRLHMVFMHMLMSELNLFVMQQPTQHTFAELIR